MVGTDDDTLVGDSDQVLDPIQGGILQQNEIRKNVVNSPYERVSRIEIPVAPSRGEPIAEAPEGIYPGTVDLTLEGVSDHLERPGVLSGEKCRDGSNQRIAAHVSGRTR
jgi:hypothetical protein